VLESTFYIYATPSRSYMCLVPRSRFHNHSNSIQQHPSWSVSEANLLFEY